MQERAPRQGIHACREGDERGAAGTPQEPGGPPGRRQSAHQQQQHQAGACRKAGTPPPSFALRQHPCWQQRLHPPCACSAQGLFGTRQGPCSHTLAPCCKDNNYVVQLTPEACGGKYCWRQLQVPWRSCLPSALRNCSRPLPLWTSKLTSGGPLNSRTHLGSLASAAR